MNTLKAISQIPDRILSILLKDRTTGKNIIWATNDYEKYGISFSAKKPISLKAIKSGYIRPRVEKALDNQKKRSKDKAEVFTPTWVVNKQNNLVDRDFTGVECPFNRENDDNTWTGVKTNLGDRDFMDYINDTRLEITCGEAPYITSRYDATTGRDIDLYDRVGLLDRKFQVIIDFAKDRFHELAIAALQNVYGYEYQGDSLFLARLNVLLDYVEYYEMAMGRKPKNTELQNAALIISWNFWQMDGLKMVVPMSCVNQEYYQMSLFDDVDVNQFQCPGCRKNDMFSHNGQYCKIKDWKNNKIERFIDNFKR